ncbi:MAG: hypothetical protein IJC15_04130, partial [Clostridia bacterium]|nr:hypothetical protein [Clostridia bacterium]
LTGDPESIRRLTEGLVHSGVSGSLVNTTRPGSGSEHVFAHFAEVVGLIRHEFHYSHGLNVGYAALLTAAMRERMAAIEDPQFDPDGGILPHDDLVRIYGDYAAEVETIQTEEAHWYADYAPAKLRENWPALRRILAEAPGRDQTRALLARVGLDFADFIAAYGEAKVGDAMLFAKDLKARHSMLWLYWALFCSERSLPGGPLAALRA